MRPKFQPIKEMAFASRVGFLTRGIWREFFAKGCPRWQNKIWARLKQERFFWQHPGLPDLYIPNAKHRLATQYTPFVAKPPNINQLAHDELVARSYLLLHRQLPDLDIKTDAYLRRALPIKSKGMRSDEVPKHPDLVLKVDGRCIAIEIELTQKTRSRYRSILRSYRRAGYDKVLYIIRSASTMHVIDSAAYEVSFPRDQIQIGFGSIGDWRVHPLTTNINFDHSTEPLSKVIGPQSASNRTA